MLITNDSSDQSRISDSANKLIEQFYQEDYFKYRSNPAVPKEALSSIQQSFTRIEREMDQKKRKTNKIEVDVRFRRKSSRKANSIGS